jgi:hypothetical protein
MLFELGQWILTRCSLEAMMEVTGIEFISQMFKYMGAMQDL